MNLLKKKFVWIIIGLIILILTPFVILFFSYKSEIDLARKIITKDESTYLILFQNSLELRPTGGFVGNFVELTIENYKIKDYKVYNTNVFDYGKAGLDSPQPFKDMLNLGEIQMRDGNWNPDFVKTAKQMEELYILEGGQKKFDGVIAINSHILPVILEVIGDIKIDTIEETITKDNVLYTIQYDLNYGYKDRGTERENRKESLVELVNVIESKVWQLKPNQLWDLAHRIRGLADEKQILMSFKDMDTQKIVQSKNWSGEINQTEENYFMLVDANLGALKTDYYMERDLKFEISDCGDKLCHKVEIIYSNTAKEASPLNTDYKSYTRILIPKTARVSKITDIEREGKVDYASEENRNIAGFEIFIPFNDTKTIEVEYTTPKLDNYNLYVQKQPGIKDLGLELKYQEFTYKDNLLKYALIKK